MGKTTEEAKYSVAQFLRKASCFDAIPPSWKIVTFDEATTLRQVYRTLVEYDTYSRGSYLRNECSRGNVNTGIVIDSDGSHVKGIITSTDFALILKYGSKTKSVDAILDYHTILSWWILLDSGGMTMEGDIVGSETARLVYEDRSHTPEFNSINSVFLKGVDFCLSPDSCLLDACILLQQLKARALPIYDNNEGICIGVISHMIVLRYLWGNFSEERPIYEESLFQLGIGKYLSKGYKIPSVPLTAALEHAVNANEAAVTILDDLRRPIGVFCTEDIVSVLFQETLGKCMKYAIGNFVFYENKKAVHEMELPNLVLCRPTDSLSSIFLKFGETQVSRLILVDGDGKFEGVVSLSDLLTYFIT